jgi:CBS domain-containing protein
MFVQEALRSRQPNIVMVTPGQSLRDAADLLARHHPGILIVSDDGLHVVGIISERDLIRSVADTELATMPKVSDIMVRDVPVCHPADPLEAVRTLMAKHGRLYLPVVADGRLAGIISLGDVLFHLFEHARLGKEALREYFLGLSYH